MTGRRPGGGLGLEIFLYMVILCKVTFILVSMLYLTNTSKSPPSKSAKLLRGLGDLLVSGVVQATSDSPRSGLLVTGK